MTSEDIKHQLIIIYDSKEELEKTDTSVHIADWIFSVAATEKKKKSPTVLTLPSGE